MRKRFLSVGLMLLLVCGLCSCGRGDGSAKKMLTVYYVNPSDYEAGGDYIEAVEYTLEDGEDCIYNALNYLTAPPEGSELESALVKGARVYSYSLEEGEMAVTLSPAYLLLNDMEKAVAKCCITLTLCGISEVETVSIYVDEKLVEEKLDAGMMIIEDTDTNEFEKQISLYFPEANYNYLQTEYRVLTVGQDKLLAEYVIEELIKSTQTAGLKASMPEKTRLLSVEQKNGVCTVDFSREFVDNRINSPSGQRMTVYSIVNSLTGLEKIDKVRFKVEGEAAYGYEYIDISDSFTCFEDIIYDPQEPAQLFATVYLEVPESEMLVRTPVIIERDSEMTIEENIVRYVLEQQPTGGYSEVIPYTVMLGDIESVNGVCSIELESSLLGGESSKNAELISYMVAAPVIDSGAADKVSVSIDGERYLEDMSVYSDRIIE